MIGWFGECIGVGVVEVVVVVVIEVIELCCMCCKVLFVVDYVVVIDVGVLV